MNKKQNKEYGGCVGQGVIEYLILVTVVIVVLLVFLGPGGHYSGVFNRVMFQQGSDMFNAALSFFR